MKIVKLQHSVLLLKVDPTNDEATCSFWFFVTPVSTKFDKRTFPLKELTIKQVKEFYINLANDWSTKYRL